MKVKAGKKIGDEPVVAFAYLPDLEMIICLMSSGKIGFLD